MSQRTESYRSEDGTLMERTRIVCADELTKCEDCGEPFCLIHGEHYADCDCLGPCNAEDEGWELQEQDGVLYGIRPAA
jgi:hypothetical protein